MSDIIGLAICVCILFGVMIIAHCYKESEMARAGLMQQRDNHGNILWVKP